MTGLPDYEADFEMLSQAAGDVNVKKWSKQVSRAHRKRKDKIEEMDIFMAKDQTCNMISYSYAVGG